MHYLVGLTDIGPECHAHMTYSVSKLPDSDICSVQLLVSNIKTNTQRHKPILYQELIGFVELLIEVNKKLIFLESKGFHISKPNVKLHTDSDIVLIWNRILKTRYPMEIQSLISNCALFMQNLKLNPFQNLNIIDQNEYSFSVDQLTKISNKDNYKTILKRHNELRKID